MMTKIKTLLLVLACAGVLAGAGGTAQATTTYTLHLPLVRKGLAWWHPTVGSTFQVQFTGEAVDNSVVADVFDIDLFGNDAAEVATLHAAGRKVLCYINIGAWENWVPDQAQFPAIVLGNDYIGWPGEKWLDIRRIDLLGPIMLARLDLCRAKGFDGVEPDNVNGYLQDTGFPLTYQDQIAYNLWFANAAHQRGLAVGLKNAPEQLSDVLPYFDFAVTESCLTQGWCAEDSAFIANGKPVFAIEYVEEVTAQQFLNELCPQAANLQIKAILKNLNLDAWRQPCP